MTENNNETILLTASEAAFMLGVSRTTFKQMVAQYKLPRIKVNKAIKYPKSALINRINQIANDFENFLSLDELI